MTKKKEVKNTLPLRDSRGRFLSLAPVPRETRSKVSVTTPIDFAFSLDTTGSMAPCRNQVRNHLRETAKYLFKHIPNLRISIISHGDYCDGPKWMSVLDLTDSVDEIDRFLKNSPDTGGGDSEEAYEAVIHRVRTLSWRPGSARAFVLIADDRPHHVGYKVSHSGPTYYLDWRVEAKTLTETNNVKIYPIQCLGLSYSNSFYEGLAEISKTFRLELAQYSDINNILVAIAMQQSGQLDQFEKDRSDTLTVYQKRMVDHLAGRKVEPIKKTELSRFAVNPSRFQMFIVDKRMRIDDFVAEQGLNYTPGRGYYEFTKPEEVQAHKEVVLQDRTTGEMFAGDKAKELLGIPLTGADVRIKPKNLADILVKYAGFIQSTSTNRILIPGTRLLYDTGRA
jgi:hypothetical protein